MYGRKHMGKTHPKLSIIIVNYNTKDLLYACLTSLFTHKKKEDQWEIIIVDNASSDKSQEEIKNLMLKIQHVKLIQNKANMGYAAANNQGIRASKGDYILLLNSDTEVRKGTIQNIISYADSHHDIAAATCRVELANGSLDMACHRGFPTPWAAFTYFSGLERIFPRSILFSQYHQGYKNMSKEHMVDCISGAFFFIRRSVIETIGFLDEAFFMYGEDIDWCYRIRQKGIKIAYIPQVSVIHKKWQSGFASDNMQAQKQTKQYFYEAMRLFYDKHYRTKYGWLVSSCVLFGIKLLSL